MNKEHASTVTLTFNQFWEIERLLKEEIQNLTEMHDIAVKDGCEDGKQIFKVRLESVKDALEAVSKWGSR